MEFSLTSTNTNTYKIIIAQNNNNPTINIWGPHPDYLTTMSYLLCRSFMETIIPWQDNDGRWIPNDVKHFCDKLAKNKAFI